MSAPTRAMGARPAAPDRRDACEAAASASLTSDAVLIDDPRMLASLALLLVTADPGATDVRFVAGLVAAAFSAQPEVSVLTRDDLRRAMDLEAEKQTQGCDDAENCLAEIAAAMDARLVVYGTVDVIGDEFLLQLNVFDAESAQGLDRATARAATVNELASVAEAQATTLAVATRARVKGQLRILVLDVEVRGAKAAVPPPPWLWIGAGSLLGTGTLALLVAAFADSTSVGLFSTTTSDKLLDASAASARYSESDGWATVAGIAYVVGGVALAGGVVVGVLAAVEE